VPTPVIQFAARDAGCPNLAIITASHNPGKYNGIKFLVDGRPAVPDLMTELQAGVDVLCDPLVMGALGTRDVIADYETWVVSCARDLVAAASRRRTRWRTDRQSAGENADPLAIRPTNESDAARPPQRVAVTRWEALAPTSLRAYSRQPVTTS